MSSEISWKINLSFELKNKQKTQKVSFFQNYDIARKDKMWFFFHIGQDLSIQTYGGGTVGKETCHTVSTTRNCWKVFPQKQVIIVFPAHSTHKGLYKRNSRFSSLCTHKQTSNKTSISLFEPAIPETQKGKVHKKYTVCLFILCKAPRWTHGSRTDWKI